MKRILLMAFVLFVGCNKGGGATAAVKAYADEMCKCKDTACIDKVQKRYQDRLAKLKADEVRPKNAAELEVFAKESKRANECFGKAAEASMPSKP